MSRPASPPGRGASRRPLRLALVLPAAVLFAACATPPPPTAELAATTAAVAHASGAGGNEFAPQEMQLARDKLLRANAALNAKDYPMAIALSREAQADAQLAEAKAESMKARQGAASAREGNRVLREEIQRKTP